MSNNIHRREARALGCRANRFWITGLSTAIVVGWCCPSLPAGDREPLSGPRVKRFMAYAWHGSPGTYDNLVPFFWVTRSTDPEAAKAATDAMPEGHRVLFSWNLHGGINGHPDDRCRDAEGNLTKWTSLWWDHGVEQNAQRFDDFFRRYRAIGGKLDTLVLDYEVGMMNWVIRDEDHYRAIMADARFEPITAQLGFRDLMTVKYYLRYRGKERSHYLIWNALMHERATEYLNRAFYEPVRKYFPDVQMSNYGYFDGKPPHTCPDSYGHDDRQFSTGAPMHVGTHQSRSLYCQVRHIRDRVLSGGHRPYGDSPFAGFRLGVNQMRSMVLSGDVPVAPWISHKRYGASRIKYGDLYQELIFHVGLCGPDVFLLWNPQVWRKDRNSGALTELGLQDRLVSDCLHRLDELVGAADRKTRVEALAGWYDDFVLSGMNAGGRSVWRLTPNLGIRTRQELVQGTSPLVFCIGPTEVRIPGGELYRPEQELSHEGFWILAPADSRPVVTTDWTRQVTQEDRDDASGALTRFDRNSDGALDADEVRNLPGLSSHVWLMGDTDKDGRLTSNELAAADAMKRYDSQAQEMDRLSELAEHVRFRYDTNRNTLLERSEWQRRSSGFADLAAADDGDGLLSHRELMRWLARLRSPLPDRLRSLDADGDGLVTRSEYGSGGTPVKAAEFEKEDQNGDGIVTADEGVVPRVRGKDAYSNDRPRVVGPRGAVYSDITIRDDAVMADVDVRLSLSHRNVDQLDIILIGPSGQRIELYTGKRRPWNGGPLFANTIIDDEAPEITTTLAQPPLERTFRPEGAGRNGQAGLSSLYGTRVGGTWRLVVRSDRSDVAGLLHGWSLLVRPE
jgi:subtilisin-like proprotein convertase family protein/Ca2+-binding EF-hand superfamily protein